jgi:hypothetical protein
LSPKNKRILLKVSWILITFKNLNLPVMKTYTMVLLFLLAVTVSKAQVIDLTGTWTMFEMAYVKSDTTLKMTEDQMKADGSHTDYFFMEEGKFKLTSNMTGSGTEETAEGTWKLAENKLTTTLKIGEQLMDIVWNFEFKDNVMKLSRTSPDGSLTIVNSFRKK